jgi:hypothetical protein
MPTFPDLIHVFIMHFDEVYGNMPLLVFPGKSIKDSEKLVRFLKYHHIWFLESEDQYSDEHIDLIYDGKAYLARKYQITSKLGKTQNYQPKKGFDLIVVFIIVPKELASYGLSFLNEISEMIFDEFNYYLSEIIESEILKERAIKTPKMRKIIEKGDLLKEQIINLINLRQEEYFSSILSHLQEH